MRRACQQPSQLLETRGRHLCVMSCGHLCCIKAVEEEGGNMRLVGQDISSSSLIKRLLSLILLQSSLFGLFW